jgi:hypothetical protein
VVGSGAARRRSALVHETGAMGLPSSLPDLVFHPEVLARRGLEGDKGCIPEPEQV